MAGFLKNRSGSAFEASAAVKLKDIVEPAGTSGLDPDLQANIGMGRPGYTKTIGSALGGSADLSGLGTADAADFQRVDNHTRSPMSQTYFKRSAV
jgi:hypothetical protein